MRRGNRKMRYLKIMYRHKINIKTVISVGRTSSLFGLRRMRNGYWIQLSKSNLMRDKITQRKGLFIVSVLNLWKRDKFVNDRV